MLSSKEFLTRCEKLARLGFFPKLEAGMKIGRGYADLGYEEFLLLENSHLLSLLSGQKSTLPIEHRAHFFCIPGVQDFVDELDRLGFDIQAILYEEQRMWVLQIKKLNAEARRKFRHRELEVALADALLALGAEV